MKKNKCGLLIYALKFHNVVKILAFKRIITYSRSGQNKLNRKRAHIYLYIAESSCKFQALHVLNIMDILNNAENNFQIQALYVLYIYFHLKLFNLSLIFFWCKAQFTV